MGKFVGKITDTLGLTDIKGTQDRANQSAAAQAAAAREAAEMARFRPYNITTALGGVRFGDQTADITYNPALARYRDQLFGLAGSELPVDVEAARAAEYDRLVAGSRRSLEEQTAALGSGLFRSGRQGLDIYGANPEMRAFASSLADRELALRQAAEQQIAGRIAQSTGLFTSGLGVEQAMLQPLEIGANLGGRQAQAGAAAGQLLGTGLTASALTQQRGGDAASGQLTGFTNQLLGAALGKWMLSGNNSGGGLFGGGSSGGQGYFGGITPPAASSASIYGPTNYSLAGGRL
jgi:hypothetical protein